MTDAKICGLSTPDAVTAAIEGGARLVGFVFYPPSPRHVELETAAYLAQYIPKDVHSVGLFVDPSDEDIETTLKTVPLAVLQLHGSESPGRVAEIKSKFGLQIIKALSVSSKSDLDLVPGYEAAADFLMFDAKPDNQIIRGTDNQNAEESDHPIIRSSDHPLPGGNGLRFDWTILDGFTSTRPWILAGGLTPENVREAIQRLDPDIVDVSSGVESEPGIKDPAKIRAFLEAVKQA